MLETPEEMYAPAPTSARRRSRPVDPNGRGYSDDFAAGLPDPNFDPHFDSDDDDTFQPRRRKTQRRLRFQGRALKIPATLLGRIAATVGFLAVAGALIAGFLAVRSFFLHDSRFVIASSSSIQIVGNTHLTRPQLLSVFGGDVERNIFNVPLAQRRTELESLPWVQHATVMRLLPNHLRISIVERTPVAFVRQSGQIGLVDAGGVLLDMPADAPGDPHYSFPVVTGIAASDPLSTRAARMKIYTDFTTELDSTGDHISAKLSEVDLSNPEDVKALIPEGASDILVHFGDTDFLGRYRKFEDHLAEWRTQYPKLASVDMRYERQVVLEMQPGSDAPATKDTKPAPPTPAPASTAAKPALAPIKTAPAKPAVAAKPAPLKPAAKKPAAKPTVKDGATPKPTVASAPASEQWHMVVVKPHSKEAAALAAKAQAAHPTQAAPQ